MDRDTRIILCSGVPLDTTYRNTLHFENRETQTSYFISKAKHDFTNQSFQRMRNGKTRLAISIDSAYDCNYIMYRNTGYSDKWFYGFITSVEYVSDNATDVMFTPDVMQTWLFDWSFKQTYVSRATPNSDDYGANILPEPLQFSDTAYANIQLSVGGMVTGAEDMAYVFGTTEKIVSDTNANPTIIGGCPQACFLYGYSDFSSFATAISTAVHEKDGNVQFAFAIPERVHNAINNGNNGRYPSHTAKIQTNITIPASTLRTNYSGTTWNKCLVYPYQALIVMTPNGYMEFDPSGFSGDAKFTITYTVSPTPSYIVTCNYMDKTVELDGGTYPTIPFSNDQYPQYALAKLGIAQSLVSQAQSNALGVMQGVITGLAGGSGSLMSTAPQIFEQLGINTIQNDLSIQQREETIRETQLRTAPSMHGSASDFAQMLIGRTQPTFYIKYLRAEYAESLDSYFTVKGYCKNKLVTPRKTSMKHYKYLQTVDCDITGNVPSEYKQIICQIHNNGVTYWSDPSKVGVY